MRRRPSICDACARLQLKASPGTHSSLDRWIPYCEAFPRQVPREIYTGQADHREPFPGDGGVLFKLREGAEQTLMAYENSVRARLTGT